MDCIELELDLARVERRVLAAERYVLRQRELLKQQTTAGLPADESIQRVVELEVRLLDLRQSRNRLRERVAAAQLMSRFWELPAVLSATVVR